MASVLIVDDEPRFLQTLRRFLVTRGFAVRTAADGLEALQQLQAERPQLLVLDQDLPGKTGLEILRYLKEAVSDVRVIFMSALLNDELSRAAGVLGAKACLQKPFSLHALGNLLEHEAQAI